MIDHAAHGAENGTLDLRIAAIFVIWIMALVFGLPPLVLKQFQSLDAPIPRLLRSFSGGIIMALALVHIIPEAVTELNSLLDFPIGGCSVLFGIIMLVLLDSCLTSHLAPESQKEHVRQALRQQQIITVTATSLAAASAATVMPSISKADSTDTSLDHQPHERTAATESSAVQDTPGHIQVTTAAPPPHTHTCLHNLNSTSWVASAAVPVHNIRQYVIAYTMELGCIFHSVIIGVGLGVITEDRHLVVTLMVALAVHQGLEAVPLGSVLALTGFHPFKKFSMLLLYSITTPIGIAVGIAVSSFYDPESITSKAVQGSMNGVSGGMLLHIGMYQLVAEEFSREDLLVKPKLRFGMYAALCLGAAAMCIVGIWA
eukprot:gene9847-10006_t